MTESELLDPVDMVSRGDRAGQPEMPEGEGGGVDAAESQEGYTDAAGMEAAS